MNTQQAKKKIEKCNAEPQAETEDFNCITV